MLIGWFKTARSLLVLSSICLNAKITMITKSIGSVGRYIPSPPVSCSIFNDKGVQTTTNRNNLSNANNAAKTVSKTKGKRLSK